MSSSEETDMLESVNRERLENKMKDPVCILKRVNIKPHNYYEQNRLTVFAPQIRLMPEQTSWSLDVEKLQAENLNVESLSSRLFRPHMI